MSSSAKVLIITPCAPWDVRIDELIQFVKESGLELLGHWAVGPGGLDDDPENDEWKRNFMADIDAADIILRTDTELSDSWIFHKYVKYFLNYIKEKNKPEVVFTADWRIGDNPAFDYIYFSDDVERVMEAVREKLAAKT